jgi:hypothetical protein
MSDKPLAIMPEPHTNMPKGDVELRKLVADMTNGDLKAAMTENGFGPEMIEGWTRSVRNMKLVDAIKQDREEWKKDFGKYAKKK